MAVLIGIAERFVVRDFAYRRTVVVALLVYVVCICALSASYVINYSSQQTIPWAMRHISLGYDVRFFSLVLNVAVVPLALFAVRICTLAEFRFIILMWTLGALYGAAFTVAYTHGWIHHFDWYYNISGRARGLTPQPNILAINTVLALPGLLLFWCKVHGWLPRLLIVFALVVLWQAVNLTGSRSALGLIVAVLLVFVVMQSDNKVRGLFVGLGLFVAALLLREVIAAVADLSTSTALGRLILGAESSNLQREMLNTIAFNQWLDNPIFGVGYGMARVAHNLYIQMLDVVGVVGFLPWLCAIVMPLALLWVNRTREYARYETAALFSVVVALLAIAWVKSNFADLNVSIGYALALYLALNHYFESERLKWSPNPG